MIVYFFGFIVTISILNIVLFNIIVVNQRVVNEELSKCVNDNIIYGIDCINSINYTFVEYSSGGLGNRLLGAANIILLSIITHRYPKLKRWDEFNNFFTVPFSSFISHASYSCISLDICNMNIKDIKLLLESKTSSYICFKEIWCDMSYFVANLRIYNSLLRQYRIIESVNNNGHDDDDDSNPVNLSLEINYYLLNKVIQTKTKYINEINEIIKDKIGNYNLIGMHIRTGYGDFDDRIYLNDENIPEFINQAKIFTSQYRNESKWFVASDSSKIKLEIHRNYSVNVLPTSNTYKRSYHYNRNRDDESSLIDFLLLSKCDKLIITNQSTFGLVALFKSGICRKEINFESCMKSIGNGIRTHKVKLFDGVIY